MHPPTPRRVASPILPAPAPIPTLAGTVSPRASRSAHHIAGDVQGAQLAYSDLNACAWYVGQAGRDLRNRRALGARGLSGIEDNRLTRR